jgi:hypothetical protein
VYFDGAFRESGSALNRLHFGHVRIDEWLIVDINATKFDPVIGRCRLHRERYLRASV